MPTRQKKFLNIWVALTVSVLFFYPLFATLNDNDIILQWRAQNSLELISAVALLTALLSVALWLVNRIPNIRIRSFLIFLIFVIPFTSFFIHVLKQLGFTDTLTTLGQYAHANRILTITLGTFCVALFLFLVVRYPSKMIYVLIMILITLSSHNFLAGWTLWKFRNNNTIISIKVAAETTKQKTRVPENNFIVILFDELSYDYIYNNGSINPKYKNFEQLSLISANYHNVTSPGNQTLTAIPGLLMGRRYDNIVMKYDTIYRITKQQKEEYLKIEPDNLFAIAKAKGYKTYAYGPYLPYCKMFGQYLDGCQSFSIYNYANVETSFSLFNPIMTNLIIWPRQKPQGLLKNKAASLWQKKQTEQVFGLTLETLDEKGSIFLFSHIYPPHIPFVFNRNGYYENPEPFLQNDENYKKQVEYVDTLLGQIIDKLRKNGRFDASEIIVMADHNYRIQFPGRENVIPMLIKRPYQKMKKNIYEPVHAEQVLRNELLKTP